MSPRSVFLSPPFGRLERVRLGTVLLGCFFVWAATPIGRAVSSSSTSIGSGQVRAPAEPITQVRTDENGDYVPDRLGDTVRVRGRAIIGRGRLPDSTGIFVQDATAGIAVQVPDGHSVQRGDSLAIRGVVAHEEGLTQLTGLEYTKLETSSRTPDPFPVTVSTARGETYEGRLVRLRGRVVANRTNKGGQYLLLEDPTENAPARIAVFVHNHRLDAISLAGFGEGDDVEVTGVMSQHDFSAPYDSYYQILPREQADVEEVGVISGYVRTVVILVIAGGLLAAISVFTLQVAVRRRTEQLEESRARFRQLSEATFEGIILHKAGEIVDVNRAFTEMSGYDRDELLGRDFLDVLSESTRDLAKHNRENGTEEPYEAVMVRKNGSSFPAEMEEKVVNAGNGDVHVAAIRNITDQKERETELLLAKEEAEQMARLKSSLLNNMSHELRTPVTSIIGYAELIRDEPDGDHTEFADRIRESGLRLSRTLRSVLEMAQLESGSLDVHPADVEVDSLVHEVLEEYEALIEEKDLSVAVETQQCEPIRTDRRLLARSFSNLVHNAIKFTNRGTVGITVASNRSGVRVRVTDTGIGIDPEFQDTLFDPFTQESEGRGRTHEGTGLGLAVTKRMIDLLGGRIEVESEKGEGTVVEVEVPPLVQDHQTVVTARAADAA